jgi:hypothetical protein
MKRFQILAMYVLAVTLVLGLSIGAAFFIRSESASSWAR